MADTERVKGWLPGERVVIAIPRASELNGLAGTVIATPGKRLSTWMRRVRLDAPPPGFGAELFFSVDELAEEATAHG